MGPVRGGRETTKLRLALGKLDTLREMVTGTMDTYMDTNKKEATA